jgi:hypothetical protein
MNRFSFLLGLVVLAAASLTGAVGCGSPPELAPRQVTIVVGEYHGDDATAQAEALRRQVASQGFNDVFTLHDAQEAFVCVGHFGSWEKGHDTLTRVQKIRDAQGRYPFVTSMLSPMPEPTPTNSWPLEMADGDYSLQVAVWEDPGRARKAQAYCAELRAQGFQAYAYHGPQFSVVSVGAFLNNIFDHPEYVGLVPDANKPAPPKPQITDQKVLDLMKKFPVIRLEGELPPPEAPPKARIPCFLIAVPGHEPTASMKTLMPEAIYRFTIKLVNTRTGVADAPLPRTGVASYRGQTQEVVTILSQQLVAALPRGRKVRIGVAGIAAMDTLSARNKVDATILEAAVKGLEAAGVNITVVNQAETARIIAASRLTVEDVLMDPSVVRGLPGLDFVLTGSVNSTEPTR